jgi:hypothetical protein
MQPTQHGYSYAATLAASERINWRIEDIIGGDRRLDFSKPFLPESLARVENHAGLSPREKIVLNQIRGHNYLYIFGLVEEFILPFVVDHARGALTGDDARTRALLQFAGEEAKHIDLFKRFRAAFQAGFGSDCAVIGPPAKIAEAVLAHRPLSVALLILHIEWMTQRHYLDSVRDDAGIDPLFKSLLKHHWMEEAQHAKLDTLMVEAIAARSRPEERAEAVEGYFKLGTTIDAGLEAQTGFDLNAFERATGRRLGEGERATIAKAQHQAMRWTFLGSGMTHPNFLATLGTVDPAGRRRVEQAAPAFS